jgi:iron complex outermembrane recepter protein
MLEKKLSRSVRLMFAGGMILSSGLLAQAVLAQEVQKVTITGSSVKRIESETALPVQIVTKAEISRIGATSTQELLNSISALSSAGTTVNATGAGASTFGLSSISLRGLGAERTLVLVNGRRLAAFAAGGGAAVNVNVIPVAAIERIEVLKDGASGVYGSDAIAGVVNFILSKSFEGIEATAGYSAPTSSGGGENKKASLTGGFGNLEADGFSLVVSGSYEKEEPLFAKDRDFARTGNRLPFFSAGATGQGNIEGAVVPGAQPPRDTVGTFGNSPGTGFGNPLAASNMCESILMFKNASLSNKRAPFCAFDSNAFVGLIPARELSNLTANFTFKLNKTTELFADALYSESNVTQDFQPSPVRRSFLTSDDEFAKQGVNPSLILFPTNPVYQSLVVPYLTAQAQNNPTFSAAYNNLIGKPLSITSRVFDFGDRVTKDKAKQGRLVLGAKGVVLGQDYEVAASTNESKTDGRTVSGYFSQVAYVKIINDPANRNDFNPYLPGGRQIGALADKLQAAKFVGTTLKAKSKSDVFDSKIAGDLPAVAGITSQYAAGFQSRRDTYSVNPSEALLAGDIAGLGGAQAAIDRSRTINSVFTELVVPVNKALEVNAQVRTDRYNDVGSTTNYKSNVRYQPIKSVLLRASVGTGFRAPTLPDLFIPQTTGTSEQFNDPGTMQNNLQVNSISGGNPNLRPEKSKQFAYGLVLSPLDNFTIGADYFQVKVRDILATPSAQEIVSRFRAGDASFRSLVTLNSGGDVDLIKTIQTNTGDAIVQGVDVFANYRQPTPIGRLDVAYNGSYMNKFNQTSPSGSLSRKVGTLVEGPDATPVLGASNGGIVLRYKHALTTTLNTGDFSTTLTQNFYAGYRTGNRQQDDVPNFISSQALYDLNVIYKGIKNLSINVGVRNLFDKEPPIFIPVSNQFQAGYDINQYDPRGRFAYVTVGYKFK